MFLQIVAVGSEDYHAESKDLALVEWSAECNSPPTWVHLSGCTSSLRKEFEELQGEGMLPLPVRAGVV